MIVFNPQIMSVRELMPFLDFFLKCISERLINLLQCYIAGICLKSIVFSYGCQGRRVGEGIVREFGIDMYSLLYLKWITSKDLLHSPGNSAKCYVAAWMGGEFGGERIHVFVWLSRFVVHLKLLYC